MANSTLITGGVSTTVQKEVSLDELAPNNYLTIIWKNPKTNKTESTLLDINNKKTIEYTNSLNNAIEQGINNNNVTYAGQNKYVNLESIAKYISQNAINSGTQRTVINALIGLASGGQDKLPEATTNLLINVFGNITDNVAKDLGLSDPIQVFSQITGENVISVFKSLGDKTQDYLQDCINKIRKNKKNQEISNSSNKEKQYVGLLLGLTTSDSESYENIIAKKKVEKGSDYTTHLLPQSFKKDFTVILTNKLLSSKYNQKSEIESIEYVKNKLIEILQSQTPFDIYVRLSKDVMYKKSNVTFSSLSFNKEPESGNGYTATFTIEPISSFKSKIFVSNKRYSSSSGTGSGNRSGSSSNRKQGNRTKNNGPLSIGYYNGDEDSKFNNREEMKEHTRYKYYLENNPNLHSADTLYSKFIEDREVVTLTNGVKAKKKHCHWGKAKFVGGKPTIVPGWYLNKGYSSDAQGYIHSPDGFGVYYLYRKK